MSLPVCTGALVICSCGLTPSVLRAGPRPVVHNGRDDLATVADSLPLLHIAPFGGCSAPGHPLPALPKPCMPQLTGLWSITVPGVLVNGVPALANDAVLTCAYGGILSIASPGQSGMFFTFGTTNKGMGIP